jgi:hypothetical protein
VPAVLAIIWIAPTVGLKNSACERYPYLRLPLAVPDCAGSRSVGPGYLTMRKQMIVGTRNSWPWFDLTAPRIR